jgi:thioredoxin 1
MLAKSGLANQRESEMASDKLRTLTDSNFDQEIRNGVVLVDFWAEWCGPCRRIAPIVEELAGKYDGRATMAKLNVDENPNIPGRFMIRGIPTLLLFKNGQLADTLVGLAPKEDIARMIDKHLE